MDLDLSEDERDTVSGEMPSSSSVWRFEDKRSKDMGILEPDFVQS